MSLRHDSDHKLRKEKSKWKNRIQSWEDYEEMENHFLKEKAKHEEPSIKGTVRIIAGKAKGVQIEIPRGTRPVTDRMKTQLFDVLREDIANRTVLDLYAGSGAFGLEALSRGAKEATLVDATKHAEKALNDNVKKTGFLLNAEVLRAKVELYVPDAISNEEQFEIIFMDPPYKLFNTKDFTKITEILNLSSDLLPGVRDWNTKLYKGVIIIKHPRMYPIDKLELSKLKIFETFDFGSNALTFFAVKEPNKR